MRLVYAHTTAGPLTAGSLEQLERKIAERAAYDAVRSGQGEQRPWLVDENGKPTRPLKRYVEYLTPASIYEHESLSPPHRAQNVKLRDFLEACESLPELGIREGEVIDPVARVLLRREAKSLAARLLRLLDGAEHLAQEIETL